MKKRISKYIICFVLVLFATNASYGQVAKDTATRYPVSPIIPQTYKELKTSYPIDLRDPDEFNDEFEFNPKTNRYELRTKIGDTDVATPLSLTQEEYLNYTLNKSMKSYFKSRNDEEYTQKGEERKDNDALSMFDFNFDLGPAAKIFGPGGVRLQANGSLNTKIGMTYTSSENPTQSERQRKRFSFDFDPQIQANITASVGDKVNFDLDYNTESTFGFNSKKLKLAYEGKEDEIIKVLEAGNVSMHTTNSLINGGAALFGIRTQLQFGKLTVDAIFSQQESQSRSTSSKGSTQTTPFEITADSYDENMHFFLAHYFPDIYDKAMKTLPSPQTGISIDEIEVWVTNKRSNYDEARNIVAFADLGESNSNYFSNKGVVSAGVGAIPQNSANNLYSELQTTFASARDASKVNQVFQSTPLNGYLLENGKDYEKIENARKLNSSEYRLNSSLGYISLRTQLQPDEVLAVAFKYTYQGKTYTVGEMSTSNSENPNNTLFLKLLKGTSLTPESACWRLMMKNVYTVSNRSIEKDKFRLDIKYQNDSTGTYINYLPEGNIANKLLLRVMNLDRLNTNNDPYADGFFDYVEGYTVASQYGKIIFPVVEPFGRHLIDSIGDANIAEKYAYTELYDMTLTAARQVAEKNKFLLTGEYKGSGSSNIELDGYNIAQGSVTVTANGVRLKENQDYTVNYSTGEVSIINPAYENANIQTSYENQSAFGMQRKTMMGVNLNYAFSKDFNVGATLMNLSEMPLTMKVNPGEESVNNTLFGFNVNYSTQSRWLTNALDKIPLLDLTAPSQITFNAEYAQLIAGHYKSEYGGDHSYIDDFEKAKMPIDLRSPYSWKLASTPSYFPESKNVNDLSYGNNRSLLAWYYIDGLFTRRSSLTPTHIKNDNDQLSNHYVREIRDQELFPNKDIRFNESSTIPVLNLAFYPKERGPYNLDRNMNSDGTLKNPENRWGGIFRKLESGQTDFEANNIEYIEFWVMDPFIYNTNNSGAIFFDLGDVSEDILKDEKKFFENGLPVDGDLSKVEETVWGYVPKVQSLNYAFDNDSGKKKLQDVGLNGLSTEQEYQFPTYKSYLNDIDNILSAETKDKMQNDPFSPINDPAGDNYHYFRGSDYDAKEMPILGRYKRYNGTEGNSVDAKDSPESYATAAQIAPDVEDLNQDNTLNELEQYFQYRVGLHPDSMNVGQNFIVDKRIAKPSLKNGKTEEVTWYQFKIPIQDKDKRTQVGKPNMQSIRFVRMFMTNFTDSVILRFATLELVRGDWRTYNQDLQNPNMPTQGTGAISVAAVNLEENGDKQPVNYIMPPGVNRMTDPGQPQMVMQNEQALSAKITNLEPGDARAVYKNTGLDTRQYKRIQMFVHAEKLPDVEDPNPVEDNELSIFIRMGSDYKSNYYEYEIPLKLTPHSSEYSNNSSSDREIVWPSSNMFNFRFELLTDLKLSRNKKKRAGEEDVNFSTVYSEFDPNKPLNKISILGNPSLSEIKVIMIGVRNNSSSNKSAEVWLNELRLTEFNEDGGWAANANLYVGLSDLGSVNVSGHKETAGFGGLDQGIMDRNLDDKHSYSIATQIDLGKFFPEKAKVNLPLYFSYSEENVSPKYNPLDQDILLKDALDAVSTKAEKDSIKNFAVDKITTKSLDLNNVRVNITSKNPMPYDPANFTLGYSTTENNVRNATTEYERQLSQRLLFSYVYSPMVKPLRPFNKKNKGTTKSKLLNEFQFGFLPKSVAFNSDINRNYYEIQLRDLGSIGENMIPVSHREDFYWNRTIAINWELTKNLKFDFNNATNARIDAPHVQVNKKFNMDDYELWKDGVTESLKDMGTPMEYSQNFNATYQLPFKAIPVLDFISGSLSYRARYDWQRGAALEDAEYEMGHTINNERTIGLDNISFNLLNLYNKNSYLEKVNKKYVLNKGNNTSSRTRTSKPNPAREKAMNKKYEGKVQLSTDTAVVVNHGLNNKRIRVTARNEEGKLYQVKFKKLNNNSIKINNKDSVKLDVTISQLPPLDNTFWYKFGQGTARTLMMVRNVNFTYSQTQGLMLPYFKQDIGDWLGQGSTAMGKAPGWDFAFGLVGESYIDKALKNDWVYRNDLNVNPAMYNVTEMFSFSALVEPFVGLKINLNGNRTNTERTNILMMQSSQNKRYSGDFTMTTITLGTSFGKSNADNGYASKAFNKFLSNRDVIANRLEKSYANTQYPNSGFLEGTGIIGNYDPDTYGGVNANSSDVLIPAFLAAYTGKSASKISLNPFPALKNLVPNWKISYEGLIQIAPIKKLFKSFVLEHEYKSRYTVGSYNSHTDWTSALGELGYVQNQTTGNPSPSSPYNITAVSISELFDPLIRINSTLHNNMSVKFEYKTTRNVNLNVSSYQIVESSTSEIGGDVGYRIENFNRVIKLRSTGGRNFNNELRASLGLSYRKSQSLIRKIHDNYTQPQSGDSQFILKLTADYSMSRLVTMQAYFDQQISKPLISSTAYPMTKTAFGITVKISLSR
ncbi:cell surface protein SprA [Dysgonomonadaceae bacterium PH5-43]|nr:cell surface protein SprA [Dysgonomonadaceae bacterium PH5-43]